MDNTPPSDAPQAQDPTGTDDDFIYRQLYPPTSEPSENLQLPTGIHDFQPPLNYQDVSLGGGGEVNGNSLSDPMVWMPMMGPDCSGTCAALRDVIHGKDGITYKLSLHGAWGVIYHAVLTVHQIQNHVTSESRFIVDLSSFEFRAIKTFLEMYAHTRHVEGLKVLLDTVPPIYRELAVPLNPGRGGNSQDRRGEAAATGRTFEVGQSSSSSSQAPAKTKKSRKRQKCSENMTNLDVSHL